MNKKVLLGAVVSIILLAVAASVSYLNRPDRDFVTYQDPKLSGEASAANEQRFNDALRQVGEVSGETKDEDKFDRYVNLAVSYTGLGKLKEAKETYEEAFKIKDNDASVLNMYSALLVSMKDYDGALKAIKKAVELEPVNPEFWKWQIAVEKDFFQADNAKQNDLYVLALNRTGSNIEIITAYAAFLGQTGNLQSAKEYWQKAIEANPAGRATYDSEIAEIDRRLNE